MLSESRFRKISISRKIDRPNFNIAREIGSYFVEILLS